MDRKYKTLLSLISVFLITLVLFGPTLNRPWLTYDERVITDESYFPIPTSFNEIGEIIQSFGLNYSVQSSNILYSSNNVTRSCPLSIILNLLISFFCQKNSLLYHLLSLSLHLINVCLVFFILKYFLSCNRYLLILLASIWAIHPVILESVLLGTNFLALFAYMFLFLFLLDFIRNKEKNNSLYRQLIIPTLFLIPMLANEYIVSLPFILFIFSFYETYQNNPIKKALYLSLQHTKPYFFGFFLYLIFFFFISNYSISQTPSNNYFILFVERVCWLSPQIFFHLVKLIFFPLKLSIDQGIFVHLGHSLFDPYSNFCILFMLVGLFIPLFVFLYKKKLSNVFLLSWGFFFALLPFLHILMPSYTLAAERYLYVPLAIFVFCIGKIINDFINSKKNHNKYFAITITLLLVVLIGCFSRSYIRTLDWKNDFTFINSTIQDSQDLIHIGLRVRGLGESILKANSNDLTEDSKYLSNAQVYLYKAINKLNLETRQDSQIPLITKSYGLDNKSLLVKAVYLVCIEPFNNNSQDKKEYLNALNFLKEYLKFFDIFDPRVLELYANLLIKNNDIKGATKIFNYAYNKYPTNSALLISLIRLKRDIEHDPLGAESCLKKALTLYPYSKDILFEAVRYYQIQNNLEEYSKYAYLYGLRAHSAFTYKEALTGFLTLNQIDKAKKTVDKLLNLDSKDPKTLYLVSSYYIKIQKYDLATTLLNQALLYKPDKQLLFDTNNLLANLYLAQGNIEQGIYHITQAISITGDSPENKNKIVGLIKKYGINLNIP